MTNLMEVEGIGEVYASRLKEAGVTTAEALLEMGASSKGRQVIAEKSSITVSLILQWVNHLDLFRIKGVGSEYADLLEAAGVDTIPELAQRNPANLHQKLVEVNGVKHLVRQLPTSTMVMNWIEQAKELPRLITY